MSSLLMKWVNGSEKVHHKTCPIYLLNHDLQTTLCEDVSLGIAIFYLRYIQGFVLLYNGYLNSLAQRKIWMQF